MCTNEQSKNEEVKKNVSRQKKIVEELKKRTQPSFEPANQKATFFAHTCSGFHDNDGGGGSGDDDDDDHYTGTRPVFLPRIVLCVLLPLLLDFFSSFSVCVHCTAGFLPLTQQVMKK